MANIAGHCQPALQMYIAYFLISLAASIGGAICGIGGGIIIKPLLDAFGLHSVSTISFLSGCTVLAMACYSVSKNILGGKNELDMRIATPLAIGAAIGGVAGSWLFEGIAGIFADKETVGAIQAIALILMCIGILIYTLRRHTRTLQVRNPIACAIIGLVLGLLSAFLGIGGGPMNLAVLSFFFSLDTKKAAQNSLYVIMFSQIFAIGNKVISGTVPTFSPWLLLLMVAGGIAGGMIGQKIQRRIESRTVERLYIAFILLTIGVNLYNVAKFLL